MLTTIIMSLTATLSPVEPVSAENLLENNNNEYMQTVENRRKNNKKLSFERVVENRRKNNKKL